MTRRLVVPGATLGVLVIAGAASLVVGRSAWSRASARAVSRLAASDGSPAAEASWDSLPAPVRRYLRFALPEPSPRFQVGTIRWSGQFRTRPGAGWVPFTADQHVTDDPPGFVWDARIWMLPLFCVRVRDGYWRGTGTMLARVAGVVPVVNEGGTPEMGQSALARWLGETVWYPAALRPGGAVRWEPVDDSSAVATVVDGEVQASAEFHFASTGEVTRICALRYRDVGGRAVLTPFEARVRDFALRQGMRVPMRGEAAWTLREGRFPYWRGSAEFVEFGGEPDPVVGSRSVEQDKG